MKNFIALFLSLFPVVAVASAAAPEVIVKGTVSEEDGGPLGFATVALFDGDSTMVCGTSADKDGKYEIKASPGTYRLYAALLGYQETELQFEITADSAQAPDILLKRDIEALKGAKLTEKVATVEMKLDKMVVNVSQSAFAQSSNALELMKKSPGVVVDKDGNVTLNGKAVSIWIDGRPSHLDGKALESLLKGTQGSTIEKFELMEHPSAKYDAEGSGGIINIKTKRNMLAGLNGNVGFDAGGMYFSDIDRFLFDENSFANLSYRTGKTNTFLNLSQNVSNSAVDLDMNSTLENGCQSSRTLNGIEGYPYQVKFGNDWFLNPRNTVGFIVSTHGGRSYDGTSRNDNVSRLIIGGSEIQRDESEIRNDENDSQLNANLNYTHVFDEKKSAELTANLDYFHDTRITDNDQRIWTSYPGIEAPNESTRNISGDNSIDIYSAKADYQSVLWGNTMFEAGAKWALSTTSNKTRRLETGPDPLDRTERFTYREHIGALYFDFARQFGAKWSVKAGLRGEYTNTRGKWEGREEPTLREYLSLFPTLFLGYNPSAKQRYSLSYTRRIGRPGYYSMNPVESYVDAHTYVVGNPDIRPSFSDNASIQAGFGQHFSVSLSYSYQHDQTTQLPQIDEKGNQRLIWGNFAENRGVYLSGALTSLPLAKWLVWSIYANGIYGKNISAADSYSKESLGAHAYTVFTFMLPREWKVEWDAYYQSPMVWSYFSVRSVFGSDLGIKKTMLDGKLNLSLNLNDVFRTGRNDIDFLNSKGEKISTFLQKFYSQSFTVGLSWNFGKASNQPARKVGILDEASRAGGGGGIGK